MKHFSLIQKGRQDFKSFEYSYSQWRFIPFMLMYISLHSNKNSSHNVFNKCVGEQMLNAQTWCNLCLFPSSPISMAELQELSADSGSGVSWGKIQLSEVWGQLVTEKAQWIPGWTDQPTVWTHGGSHQIQKTVWHTRGQEVKLQARELCLDRKKKNNNNNNIWLWWI